jgi:hypothetical protein
MKPKIISSCSGRICAQPFGRKCWIYYCYSGEAFRFRVFRNADSDKEELILNPLLPGSGLAKYTARLRAENKGVRLGSELVSYGL